MAEEKQCEDSKAQEQHPAGLRLGKGTLQTTDCDGKPITVKLSGKFYVEGK